MEEYKDAHWELIEIRLTNYVATSICDKYLPNNMRWNFQGFAHAAGHLVVGLLGFCCLIMFF